MLRRKAVHSILTGCELSATHCCNPGEWCVYAERVCSAETRSGYGDPPHFPIHNGGGNYLACYSNREDVIRRAFLSELIGFADDFAKLANVIDRLPELELGEPVIGDHWRNGNTAGVNDRRIRVRSNTPRRRLGGIYWQYDTLVTFARGKQEQDTKKAVPHIINLRIPTGREEEETGTGRNSV